MNPQAKKLLVALTSAALLAGCASGGGGGGGDSAPNKIDTAEETILCVLLPIFCIFFASAVNKSEATGVPFTTWSALPRTAATQTDSLTTIVHYESNGPVVNTSVSAIPFAASNEHLQYDEQGNLVRYGPFNPSSGATAATLAALGQPGIDVRQQRPNATSSDAGLNANPYVLGWEYQSFGVWNSQAGPSGSIRVSSFGAPTPGATLPTSGSAAFSGKVAGVYISAQGQSAMAAGELGVNANFSTRSLAFSSSGTAITLDARTASAAPHLDLKGTLSYAPNTNSFSGTLTNAGGTLSGSSQGRFYGPAAQELGGVFTVKSSTTVETFTGAYGAKR
jgi:hypothetical protein